MAKDPAMLWYWSDWNSGTTTLSRFLKGCYMDLLHAQFNSGHLSLDEIKTVLGSDFGSAWPTLQKKFKKDDDGLFFNVRLQEEKEKRIAFTSSRRRNLESKAHKDTHGKDHTVNHMDNENVNTNTNGFNYQLKSVSKKIEVIEIEVEKRLLEIFDELYMTDKVRPAFRGIDIYDQLAKFKVKVHGAEPGEYRLDDTGRMRNAFLYQLRQQKPEKKQTAPKKFTIDELNER